MSTFNIIEHIIPATHVREYARATAESQEEILQLHVKQYVPNDYSTPQEGDLTIIGAHANGFPKELYEPLWNNLSQELRRRNVRLRGIWIMDAAWQGQSAGLNEGKLGNEPSWLDLARDMSLMINTFRMPRPLAAMGHSFGACALTNVALFHPRLFSTLILMDPVIAQTAPEHVKFYVGPATLSAKRRDVWPSREAAAESCKRSAFYQTWDPAAVDLWLQHGLKPLPGSSSNEVTLSTSKHQEVFTFVRSSVPAFNTKGTKIVDPDAIPDVDPVNQDAASYFPFYRPESGNTFDQLPHVRPSVLYIFGGKSEMSQKDQRDAKLQMTGSGTGGSGGAAVGRVKSVLNEDFGHLIPMEDPKFCATHAAEWLELAMVRAHTEEQEYKEWAKLPLTTKATIGKEMMDNISHKSKI